MDKNKLIISPKTKVGEFLDAYPELENLLMEMSPAFAKLKNPILRKTVGRVASLQQAAAIGGLKVDEMVNRLRKAAGQSGYSDDTADEEYIETNPPPWFNEAKIIDSFDARDLINSGGSPMNEILSKSKNIRAGEIFSFTAPFIPAPIIDLLKNKGYRVFSVKNDDSIITYIEGKSANN